MHEETAESLGIAIALQAVEDFRREVIKSHEADTSKKKTRSRNRMRKIVDYFKGDMFRALFPNINADELLNRIEEDVVKCGYNYQELMKYYGMEQCENNQPR